MSRDQKTQAFRELHQRDGIFLLPNAWDAASARLVERLGFPAVATSSAALCAVLGFADEAGSWEELLPLMRAIGRAVALPVTFDIVGGYASSSDELLRHIDDVLAIGGSGVNLEDGIGSAEEHVARVAAVRAHTGDALVINARVDALLRGTGDVDEAIRRGRMYRDAGADSIFVPGATDDAAIGRLVSEIGAPINILATPATPPLARLRALGVRRVSAGSGVYRAQLAAAEAIMTSLRDDQTFDALRPALAMAGLRDLMIR
jgi:2-methylisocitrate lyase-like PEP mutase family enzyme